MLGEEFKITDVFSSWWLRPINWTMWLILPTKFGRVGRFLGRPQNRGKVMRLVTSERKAQLTKIDKRKRSKVLTKKREKIERKKKPSIKSEKIIKPRRITKPKDVIEKPSRTVPDRGRVPPTVTDPAILLPSVPSLISQGDKFVPWQWLETAKQGKMFGYDIWTTEIKFAWNLLNSAGSNLLGGNNYYYDTGGWKRYVIEDGTLYEDMWICGKSRSYVDMVGFRNMMNELRRIDPFIMTDLPDNRNIIVDVDKATGRIVSSDISTCYWGERKEVNPDLYLDSEFSEKGKFFKGDGMFRGFGDIQPVRGVAHGPA